MEHQVVAVGIFEAREPTDPRVDRLEKKLHPVCLQVGDGLVELPAAGQSKA